MTTEPYKRDELLHEFEWTRTRHGGSIRLAAPILGMTTGALERALMRARAAGHAVEYYNDKDKVRL